MFLVFVVGLIDWLLLCCHVNFVALRVWLHRVELVNSNLQVRPFVCPLSIFIKTAAAITIIGTHSQKLLP
jgi:hypothetical protein